MSDFTNINIILLFITAFFFALNILLHSNPIYSLLSLIAAIACVLVIFLILNIEFLALTFLIIYMGAIAILFLFVIMMFNIKKIHPNEFDGQHVPFVIITFIFHPIIYIMLENNLRQYIFNSWANLTNERTYCDEGTKLEWDFTANFEKFSFLLKYKQNDALVFSDFLYTYYSYYFILLGGILFSAMVCSIVLALASSEKNK